jgi:hypothetical protein
VAENQQPDFSCKPLILVYAMIKDTAIALKQNALDWLGKKRDDGLSFALRKELLP